MVNEEGGEITAPTHGGDALVTGDLAIGGGEAGEGEEEQLHGVWWGALIAGAYIRTTIRDL